MQRKIYAVIMGQNLYPNIFCCLVGPPGVGKTQAIKLIKNRLRVVKESGQIAEFITQAKFFSRLAEYTKIRVGPNGIAESMCNATLYVSELATFLRPGDTLMRNTLLNLYDCPEVIPNETIARNADRVENLFLCILAGTTPSGLAESLGKDSSGLGIHSRVNWIFSDDIRPINLTGSPPRVDWTALDAKLGRIAKNLWGEMTFEKGLLLHIERWFHEGMPPVPTNARLLEYNSRRGIHFLKLCMIFAASEEKMEVTYLHHEKAKETLLEAESVMAGAFSMMGLSPLAGPMRNAVHWLKLENREVEMAELRRKLLEDVQPFQIVATIGEMVASGMVIMTGKGAEAMFRVSPKATPL